MRPSPTIKTTTQPTTEPITLDELKTRLRVTGCDFDSELIDLLKADIASRAVSLRTAGFPGEAASLEALSFRFGEPETAEPVDSPAAEALDHLSDVMRESRVVGDHWIHCLTEACHGIAASDDLTHWLMSHWYGIQVDFEPAYGIWKAGGRHQIVGDTCHVYRTSSKA